MLDFLLWFPYPIRLVVVFGILFAVVPLAGVCTFGNWRQAWEYSRRWFRVYIGMVFIGCVIALLLL
jgi:threonine/homoserine/homoserine lactone efflux protein